MDIETKFAPLDLKQIEDDGHFEGLAAVFNTPDMGNDVILPGAFKGSLGRNKASA